MKFYEIPELVKGLGLKTRDSWEQTRLLAYMTAQVNSTKKIKPSDILQFEWDEKQSDVEQKGISKQDINRLSKKTDEVLKKLKKKNG